MQTIALFVAGVHEEDVSRRVSCRQLPCAETPILGRERERSVVVVLLRRRCGGLLWEHAHTASSQQPASQSVGLSWRGVVAYWLMSEEEGKREERSCRIEGMLSSRVGPRGNEKR